MAGFKFETKADRMMKRLEMKYEYYGKQFRKYVSTDTHVAADFGRRQRIIGELLSEFKSM